MDFACDPWMDSDTEGDDSDSDDDKNKEKEGGGKLQDFIGNCRYTRSLTITDPEQFSWLISTKHFDTLGSQASGLGNLVYFAVWSPHTTRYSQEL